MLSPRRIRLVLLAAITILVLIFLYTSHMNDPEDSRTIQDFYHKTVNAMDEKYSGGGSKAGSRPGLVASDRDKDGDIDQDDALIGAETHDRLKAAEAKAKEQANEKAGLRPDPPSNVIGVGSSADGQVNKGSSGEGVGSPGSGADGDEPASEEDREAMVELNSILKKSPTIIFSKTWCPFSKRAKKLLLDKYVITPEPYVVELDEHPLGPNLQDMLKYKTGRSTVPNILINGVSVGGADDIEELDASGELVERIVDLGSKRVEMARRPASQDSPY